MANYKKILVPLDGSKRSNYVLTEAINIAKRNDASIVALYVLPFSPLSYRDARIAQEVMYKECKRKSCKIKRKYKEKWRSVSNKNSKGTSWKTHN